MDNDVKQRIYDCALQLFSQYGYNGTSIRQIAEGAKTTVPMVYYYYKNKEQLFLYILNTGIELLKNSIKTKPSIKPEQRLQAATCNFLDYCSKNRTITALIFETWFGPEAHCHNIPSITQFYTEVVAQFDSILTDGIDSEYFRPHDHSELSQDIMGILTIYIARMLIGDETIDPARCSKITAELLINGIKM